MADVMLALMRTLGSLRSGKVWLYVLMPALFSLLVVIGLAVWVLGAMVDTLMEAPPMNWLAAWGMLWLAHVFAWLGGWMAIFAVAYLGASMFAAVLLMPFLLKQVAAADYPDVAAMGTDSVVTAALNSLVASVGFVVGWLLSVPLWLIPGFSLLLPLLLMGWMNRRTFAYDALCVHATDEEWRTIRRENGGALFMLGLTMALLAHIPLLGLLVPALAALSFVHFGLEALRRSRGGAIVTVQGDKP